MHPPATFAGRLLLARVNARLDQGGLGKRVGLSAHTIGRLERGSSTTVKIEVLRNLIRVLEVEADWLLVLDAEDTTPAPDTCCRGLVPRA